MRNSETFHNPILSGFYPDPSICRVGDDYYMATSSFNYYPGIPIFHSRDLIHWEQIGHGIHRPEQLDYKNCEASLGLWAPTIRYHEGTFYLINTFVSEGREVNRDNYILTAKDPAGPWSDPVFVKGADGIDPTIFFDEDGRMWYAGNFIQEHPQYEGHHGIYLCELDPETFQFIGERKVIWDGARTTSKWIEAPHLYRIGGWYYLIVAEGGTFSNHCVMMARSRKVDGDYEICPRNPIVTHRHLPLAREISVTGHADIVQTQNGEWWMVLLAVRPYGDFQFNTGRETFLVPFHWEKDGWPLLDTEDGIVHSTERKPDLPEFVPSGVNPMEQDVLDSFEEEKPDLRWNTIQAPKSAFYSLTARKGFLRLSLLPATLWKKDPSDRWHTEQPACVVRRQQHHTFEASAQMEFCPKSGAEEAGLVLLQDDRYSYLLTVGQNENGERIIRLAKADDGVHTVLREVVLSAEEKFESDIDMSLSNSSIGADAPAAAFGKTAFADFASARYKSGSDSDRPLSNGSIILGTTCRNETYDFWYEITEGPRKGIRVMVQEHLPAELLSSNVNEGFTGAYVGMYASSCHAESDNHADFDWFHYEGGRI